MYFYSLLGFNGVLIGVIAFLVARFVQTIHKLGTPFFNTINHIDALICKTLFPMICCCTEYEAGRLGRFLCETLKMAYYWKVFLQTYIQDHYVE